MNSNNIANFSISEASRMMLGEYGGGMREYISKHPEEYEAQLHQLKDKAKKGKATSSDLVILGAMDAVSRYVSTRARIEKNDKNDLPILNYIRREVYWGKMP